MITLDAVCAGYKDYPVLHHISAVLKRGTLTCILGPNGCGKSTLLKAVTGRIPISDGSILLDGQPIAAMQPITVAQNIAYLAQGKSVPDMTVAQMVLHGRYPHLRYPRHYRKEDRDIAMTAMVQMGIDTYAAQKLSSLSGGMRQNAYIAMALAQNTDCILLDEPTTYLDIAHQRSLMHTLRSLADSGKCVAAVLHDIPLALSFADELLIIKDGKVAAACTPEQCCRTKIIREVFGVTLHSSGETAGSRGYYFDYTEDKTPIDG